MSIAKRQMLNTMIQTRNRILGNNPDMRPLEGKWNHHLIVPLNIPAFRDQNFDDWFFSVAKTATKIAPDVASPYVGFSQFETVDVMPHRHTNVDLAGKPTGGDSVWSMNVRDDCPANLMEFLYDNLPITKIVRFKLWSSTGEVGWHRDHSTFIDFPGSFRMMLLDQNPEQTFMFRRYTPHNQYQISPTPADGADRNIFKAPSLLDTNTFVYNNLRLEHGSYFNNETKARKIVLILDTYKLDVDKYNKLLESSVIKYSDNLIIDKVKQPITYYFE